MPMRLSISAALVFCFIACGPKPEEPSRAAPASEPIAKKEEAPPPPAEAQPQAQPQKVEEPAPAAAAEPAAASEQPATPPPAEAQPAEAQAQEKAAKGKKKTPATKKGKSK